MLILIGFCFSFFSFGFSNLILYFLIQTIASFSLFLFYVFYSPLFMSFFLLLKLSMFPFHFWFISVLYKFSSFGLFLVCSFHKLPSFLILSYFSSFFSLPIIFASILLSLVLSAGLMLITSDFRLLVLASSVGNNSWFLMASLSSSFLLLLFLAIYSLFLFIIIRYSPFLSNTIQLSSSLYRFLFCFSLVLLAGFPPFPLFFLKVIIVYLAISFFSPMFIFVLLLFASFMLAGYFRYLLSILVFSVSSVLAFF